MTTNLLDHQMKGLFPAARNQAIIFNISIKVQPPVCTRSSIKIMHFNAKF